MTTNRLLWIVQAVLTFIFLFAGGTKLVLPPEAMAGPIELPLLLLRFIGVAEVFGAIGLILPGLLRIRPGLTPLAAVGLSIITAAATVITVMGGQVAVALIPLLVCLLAAAVAYGRWRIAPLEPTSGASNSVRPSEFGGTIRSSNR
jgi:DoxX-like family